MLQLRRRHTLQIYKTDDFLCDRIKQNKLKRYIATMFRDQILGDYLPKKMGERSLALSSM